VNLHFLSGIPRSGSTVLAAVLNQHPQLHVSTTSGLVFALDGLANTWHSTPLLLQNDPDRARLAAAMRGLISGYYGEQPKPAVLDKSRGWPVPVIMSAMRQVLGRRPRIVATVRSIPDCMASFVRIAKPDNLDEWMDRGELATHLKAAYQSLRAGYEHDRESFLIVEYDDLMADPRGQLSRVHEFLGLDPFAHDLDRIDGEPFREDDEGIHGYAGLHDVRPKLARAATPDPREVLRHHHARFCQPEFWLDQPRTKPEPDLLDLQLAAAKLGDLDEGERIADELARTRPDDSRAAFNRGFYELRRGNLLEGHRLLYRGRRVAVFGDPAPRTTAPMWDGQSNGTVLLRLEGGLGDQINQMRHVRDLRDRCCDVAISCSPELFPLVGDLLVSGVVASGHEHATPHDYWIPAMSAPLFLRQHYADVSGRPFLMRKGEPTGRLTIGLRWSGNKQFEHEHHKLFPPGPFFDAVKRDGVRFVSLQRDADLEHKPDWVETVPLKTWADTRRAVSACDLVVSSCTSVSHLAAAMGVPTAIIIPAMPYYLYALPGDRTPYYRSVKLLRQRTFGDWSEPMRNLQQLVSEFERGAQL
jgi:hypothetical protein